ncbi:UNVERIFIED_CONTAM: hypothetical protein Sangu_2636300 [Sesamum angustifolium]|uniref:Secreted protein n=1 Tax=Sesamum angustifolium TaxID=2727405 RepID=A0AAW2J477_9LAMI
MCHPFLFLLIFLLQQRVILFRLLHWFFLLSSLLHSSSTSGSIHPMVTRSRDGTRRPRAWFQSFSSALVALGFSCSRANPSMFIWRSSSEIVILLLYVDISF